MTNVVILLVNINYFSLRFGPVWDLGFPLLNGEALGHY